MDSKLLVSISDFVNKCLGPLGVEGVTSDTIRDLIIQLIAVLILFLIVKFFLWEKITKLLDARKDAIDAELNKAKEASANALEIEAKLALELENSKAEIQTLIANAINDGKAIKEEIIAEAKKEAELRIGKANTEIQNEIKKQQKNIKDEIVTIAFAAAEKIVAKEVDKKKHLKVVTDLIESGLE